MYRVEFMIIVFGCEKCHDTQTVMQWWYCGENKTMDAITLILNYKELSVNYTLTF